MSRTALSTLARNATRQFAPRAAIPVHTSRSLLIRPLAANYLQRFHTVPRRSFGASRPQLKGLSPETDNPQPKEAEANTTASAPAELSAEQYAELSDTYMDALVEKLEQLQEESEEIDVEYSAGVLNLTFPPNGTYVINKQPPNKQIWLSSPISGPKRYDFVVASEGQDAKEGTGSGQWVYLRDGSTLNELLLTEVGVDMDDPYAPVPHMGE